MAAVGATGGVDAGPLGGTKAPQAVAQLAEGHRHLSILSDPVIETRECPPGLRALGDPECAVLPARRQGQNKIELIGQQVSHHERRPR